MLKKYLKNILLSNFDNNTQVNDIVKVIFINSFAILSILTSVVFTIISLKNGAVNLAYILIGLSVILSINSFFLYKTKNINNASYVTLSSIGLVFIYLLFDAGKFGYGYLWFSIYPMFSMLLLGIKKGSVFSVVFFIILLILFFVFPYDFILAEYTYPLRIRVSILYLIFLLIAYIYEFVFYRINKSNMQAKVKDFDLLYKKDFIEQLSNEIRNISNNIYGLSNVLNEKVFENDANKQIFSALKYSSSNLLYIINNLLEISDFEKYDKVNLIDFNLENSIQNILKMFKDSNNSIELNISDNMPKTVNGNPFIIKQIIYKSILTLISNNNDFNSKIVINLIFDNLKNNIYNFKFEIISFNKLSVIDKHNYKNKLSEVFLGDDEIKKLGLLEIKKYLESSGNIFNIITNNNNETKISFSYKYKKLTNNKKYEDIFFSNDDVNNTQFYYSKNVLIVDDNLINQRLLGKIIEKYVKTIDFAKTGKEALKKYENNTYDLIFMDINLPNYSGNKIAKKIREIEYGLNTHIPIIAVSANVQKKDMQMALESGMDSFISKPFKKSDIIKILKKYFDN